MPTALTYLYASQTDAEEWLSEVGATAWLDDDADGDSDVAAWVTKARSQVSARINRYVAGRHTEANLAENWQVHEWATILLAHKFCTRRGNPAPTVVEDEKNRVIEELKEARDSPMGVFGIELRHPAGPLWSNVRVDTNYELAKTRVQRPISEKSDVSYRRHIDHAADRVVEP